MRQKCALSAKDADAVGTYCSALLSTERTACNVVKKVQYKFEQSNNKVDNE